MHIKNLSLVNYKNYDEVDIAFSPKINCFTGDNGSGKTNLLDAIYYLAFTKSYFNAIDSQNINYEKNFFVIEGDYIRENKSEHIYCGIKKGRKKILKRNNKEYTKLSEHIGLFPTVIISPYDIKLILEGGTERRKFMDSVISQYDKSYLENIMKYNKALHQRNKLLKNLAQKDTFNYEYLEPWDEQMAHPASDIYRKRNEFVNALIPLFKNYYTYISGDNEVVDIRYNSHLHENDLKSLFAKSLEKDKILQYTTKGLHRDDLDFTLAEHPIKKGGSQGQQKTFLISLKLAQLELMQNIHGFSPILLLDDVFDKLDNKRAERIINIVAGEHPGQIFMTDTNKDRITEILNKIHIEHKLFEIRNGKIYHV